MRGCRNQPSTVEKLKEVLVLLLSEAGAALMTGTGRVQFRQLTPSQAGLNALCSEPAKLPCTRYPKIWDEGGTPRHTGGSPPQLAILCTSNVLQQLLNYWKVYLHVCMWSVS